MRRAGYGEHFVPLVDGDEGPADAADFLHPIDCHAVRQATHQNMIAPVLAIEGSGAVVAGRLHDDHPPHGLAALVGVVDEQVGKGPQELAAAELENGFG